ncbi:MAG: CsbD family protein [Rhodospirillaceae bacterium]|nr:CsbD family protein [Rhodospirillaceae bacterium]
MNRDILEGRWKQLKGQARQKWGELTDDDIEAVEGRHEELVGRIQARYGIAREEAQREVNAWIEGK